MFSWLISKIPGFGGASERDPMAEAALNGRRTDNELQSIKQDLAKEQAAQADGSASSGVADGGSSSFGSIDGGGMFFDAGG